jgi:orotate phosphoribosyltransferase
MRSGNRVSPERAHAESSTALRTARLRPSKADIARLGYGALAATEEARKALITALRDHALVIGEVTLTSGRKAQYYVDAKRAILLPDGFRALSVLVAAEAARLGATAVGGTTMGADPIACAALAGGADVKAFFIRKERKEHGLQRWVEGPPLEPGERCLVVEDVVTTGGSTVHALDKLREEGHQVVGVVSVLDRLAGGGEAIEEAAGAPYVALATIDDVYPDRADR